VATPAAGRKSRPFKTVSDFLSTLRPRLFKSDKSSIEIDARAARGVLQDQAGAKHDKINGDRFGALTVTLHPLRLALLTLAVATASAQQPDPKLQRVLDQLDAASKSFQSAAASVQRDVFTKAVSDTSTECGSIYYLRDKSGAIQMGMKTANIETNSCTGFTLASGNESRIVAYKNGTLNMFEPKADHLTVMKAGANQAMADSFLTLGFGASGHELAKAWNITDQGQETISDIATEKLSLKSKDPKIAQNFAEVTLWVDLKRGLPLKQKFLLNGGDYSTMSYTNIQYNQKNIDTSGFVIKTNKKTVTNTMK